MPGTMSPPGPWQPAQLDWYSLEPFSMSAGV
jgi:hypothetical protein